MGKVYNDMDVLKSVINDLIEGILQGDNKNDFLEKNIKVNYHVKDPDFSFFLDPAKKDIYTEDISDSPDISLTMESDFMHDFWLKKTNILESIKKGYFKVELAPYVATAKLIDLLPVLAKGLDVYPDICKKNGISI